METVPQTPTTSPLPSILVPVPSNTFFDYSDADIILRSCDLQEFRGLKVYVVKSSPILSERIQAISGTSESDPAISTSASGSLLTVLALPYDGAILSSLLTFIFPIPPVLPPILEETILLLSAAQKYEMVSVLDHIRDKVASKDPPFIHPDNAFHAFSLAQKYGLHHEATQAAKATLKFTLTIEDQEENLDVMPGAYLHELWKYHQSVRSNLLSNINDFKGSASYCNSKLKVQHCVSPKWLDDYIISLAYYPSFFDPIEFQLALARHVSRLQANCYYCASISSDAIRTFWAALTKFVDGNVAKAESTLSIIRLEQKACSQEHSRPPVPILPLPESMFTSEADIIIQSSDLVEFPVHKSILACSSQIFRDVFSLPQPPDEITNALPILPVSEDAELIRALITCLYPIPSEIPVSYDKVLALLAASQKYDMPAIRFAIRAEISYRELTAQTGDQAFRAYAIASRNELVPETATAARLTLDYPLTFDSIGSDLQHFEGWALRDLANYRKSRRDDMVSCFESYLDIRDGPSKIWAGCPAHETNSIINVPVLPSWLHSLFTRQITELKEKFTNALVQPSSIRGKYLAALQAHKSIKPRDVRAGKMDCTFCLGIHARLGEEYCVELERKLELARNRAFCFNSKKGTPGLA